MEREYIKGFIQNPYHDYRHILDIKTILSFGYKLQKCEEITEVMVVPYLTKVLRKLRAK